MIYLKTNPVGVDVPINRYQQFIYDELSNILSIDGYGVCYKNENQGNVIPEVFKSNTDYSGTLLTVDKSKFFFSLKGNAKRQKLSNRYKDDGSLYFLINLKEAYPDSNERENERAKLNIVNIVNQSGLSITKIIEQNTEEILSEFKGAYKSGKYDNLHPYFIMRCDFEITYTLTENEC